MPGFLVLNVSFDLLLLETRGRVLSSSGYTVVGRLSVSAATKEFLVGDFDAVILCHSIPLQARQDFTELVHAKNPSTPVIVVTSSIGEYDPLADASVENDPEALLQELDEVLHKSVDSNARRWSTG